MKEKKNANYKLQSRSETFLNRVCVYTSLLSHTCVEYFSGLTVLTL